jgi:hypothetical protein
MIQNNETWTRGDRGKIRIKETEIRTVSPLTAYELLKELILLKYVENVR